MPPRGCFAEMRDGESRGWCSSLGQPAGRVELAVAAGGGGASVVRSTCKLLAVRKTSGKMCVVA